MIPAGPGDDVADTVASVVRYADPSRVIVIMDDASGPDAANCDVPGACPGITVIKSQPARPGTQGGLWLKMSPAYRWLLQNYQPGIVLRLDADAVILGAGLEAAAEEVFGRDPEAGLLGSYRVRCDGEPRDFRPAARQLRSETGLRGLRHPRLRAGLRRYLGLARSHGYVDGEHVLGCAFLLRAEAIQALYENGCFSQPWLEASRLGDDQIMSLMTLASGYKIADFGGPADPIAVKWEELPAHPADLLAQGKLVTHSVRSWGDLSERQIRGIFAAARAASGPG